MTSATRRGLLLGSLVVAAAGCTSDSDPPASPGSPASPASLAPEEAAIFDLSLETVHRFRPFHLVAPGFEAELGDRLAVPFAAVEARLEPSAAEAAVGLVTEAGDHLLVRWRAPVVSLEVRTAGRTRVLRRRTVRADSVTALAFALCENQVTALVDTGEGWRPVLTERDRIAAVVDLRREEVIGQYAYAAEGEVASSRAGVFGMTGLRDPHLVQHADGTAYERDGRVFLTWTCAGLGFFQQAHWSVWSLDPADPAGMRLEAQLFSRRDGLLLGDHAGQLIRDGDRWLVATSAWGDFEPGSIHVRECTTQTDLLAGLHLLETAPAPLPTDHGSWDPALQRIDGDWHVAFVESPSQDPFDFHPALATTSADHWSRELEQVAAADSLHQCEGPILATVEGRTWLLASDGDARVYPVFDLTGRRVGRLDAPYPTNIPHPQLIPDPAGGWLMITFDGTQYAEDVMGYGGHGDVVVLHST